MVLDPSDVLIKLVESKLSTRLYSLYNIPLKIDKTQKKNDIFFRFSTFVRRLPNTLPCDLFLLLSEL